MKPTSDFTVGDFVLWATVDSRDSWESWNEMVHYQYLGRVLQDISTIYRSFL